MYCPGTAASLDTLITRFPNTIHMLGWHVPWYTPDTSDLSIPGPLNARMDLYTSGTSTPNVIYNGDSSRIGGNAVYDWSYLYDAYYSWYAEYILQDSPYRVGISGDYETGDTEVTFTVEIMIEDIDSTLDIDHKYIELFVIEDHLYEYWSHVEEWHDTRDVVRVWITKSATQKIPIEISEAGQTQAVERTIYLQDNWDPENVKIVAAVQTIQPDIIGYVHPVWQSQSANINNLDPDPDGDGLTYLYDNCTFIFNPEQTDSDGDEIGNVCDPCNGLVNVPGNVDLDAWGDDYIPIIGVADILALSDVIEGVGLPENNCHSIDMLADGAINSFDLIVLTDLVMAGGN